MKRIILGLMLIPSISFAACPTPDGSSANCPLYVTGGTQGTGSTAPTQVPFTSTSITTTNTYQQISPAASCTHGGLFTATQTASSTGVEYVDITGVAAAGTTLGNGAIPLGGSQAANQPGQTMMIPPTLNAVMIYGPSGATFRGFCS